MYTELILRPARLAKQAIHSDQARKIMAGVMDGDSSIDPALFGRGADGKTLQGSIGHIKDGTGFGMAPEIVFDGGLGFLRVYGIGHSGCNLLVRHLGQIYSSVSRQYGPTTQELRQGKCEIQSTGYMVPHHIRTLIVSKRPKTRAQSIEDHEDAVALIRRQIVAGLTSQADIVGDAQKIPDDASIEILSAMPYAVPIRDAIYAASYKNVVFAIPARLNGPWLAGHLRSRGYGLMRPALQKGGRQ